MFDITDRDKLVHQLEKDNKKPIMQFLKTLKPDGYFVNIPQHKFSKMGISDTLGVLNGRFFAFESKAKDGKPTPLQRIFLRMVTMAGGVCGVTKTVADVKELLNLNEYNIYTHAYCEEIAVIYFKFCTPKQALKLLKRWNKFNNLSMSDEVLESIINDMK